MGITLAPGLCQCSCTGLLVLLWILAKVASLQIQWYSCCLNHSSLFVVLGGGLVRICIVNSFLSCMVGFSYVRSVRCLINLCLICLVVYLMYCVLHRWLHVIRYTTSFVLQL